MDLLQIHETVVTTRDRTTGELEFLFLSVSRRMVDESWSPLLGDPTKLLQGMEVGTDAKTIAIAELPQVLLALLSTDDGAAGRSLARDAQWLATTREQDPELAGFAEYLAFADIVPFEQSDMKGQSIAGLAIKSASAVSAAVVATSKTIIAAPGVIAAMPAIAPLAPVALHVIVVGTGAVAVIDGIGVVWGIVSSSSTRTAAERIRTGLRRLVRRK